MYYNILIVTKKVKLLCKLHFFYIFGQKIFLSLSNIKFMKRANYLLKIFFIEFTIIKFLRIHS